MKTAALIVLGVIVFLGAYTIYQKSTAVAEVKPIEIQACAAIKELVQKETADIFVSERTFAERASRWDGLSKACKE